MIPKYDQECDCDFCKEERAYRVDCSLKKMEREEPCTKDNPNKESKYHPDAKEFGEQIDGWPGGDIQYYRCPHCEKQFSIELPQ